MQGTQTNDTCFGGCTQTFVVNGAIGTLIRAQSNKHGREYLSRGSYESDISISLHCRAFCIGRRVSNHGRRHPREFCQVPHPPLAPL
eukprot:757702-Hanusia_phi.AAC.2